MSAATLTPEAPAVTAPAAAENDLAAPAVPAIRAELDRDYALDAGTCARYRRDGAVHLDGVFSPALLDHYGAAIDREVALGAAHLPPLETRGTYGKAFQQICNLWTRDATVREFVFGRRLAGIAAKLMGCAGVRIYHDQALYKEPGGGHTPWHADQHYWPMSTERCITAWVPLVPVPLEMGPLAFAPGTQRMHGTSRNLDISDESEAWYGRTLADFPVLEKAYALGEVSFHAGWTFHRAGGNRSARMRRVMTVIYMDADMRVAVPKSQGQANDSRGWIPGIAPGEVAASPLNPVVYP
jgi:hypothetical protein